MRRLTMSAWILLIAFLTISPLAAQDRAVPSGGDAGRAVASGSSAATVSYSTTYSTTASYAPSYSTGATGMGNRAFESTTASYGVITSRPSLDSSSFHSYSLFNYWNNYYYYLASFYRIYPDYFARFAKNREPLMTPAMLKIALRRPLVLASDMLKAIDDLESMLKDTHAGKAVDKTILAAKFQEIRDSAKRIREDPTISIIDTTASRKAVPVKQDSLNAFDPESITALREMAQDINRQLQNLYGLTSSATVSVDSFKEPSFNSETKAIDKLCKAIEHSSKRL
jgi:hypothetical protein